MQGFEERKSSIKIVERPILKVSAGVEERVEVQSCVSVCFRDER